MKEQDSMRMSEIQIVSLEILKQIDTICNLLNIKYCLAYGTLIGAIRHKGFIPWDDDIDILMPRPDYEKFKKYVNSHSDELKPLKLFDSSVTNYPYLLPRLSNDDYTVVVDNEKPYGMGIFIDIYVLDGIGDTFNEAWNFIKKTSKYPRLIFLSTRNHYHFGTTKGFIKRLLKIPAFYYAKIMGKSFFEKKLMRMIDTTSYDKKNYVGCAIWCERPKWAVVKKDVIENLIEAPFENYKFKIPKDYDSQLRQWYGDYMQLPPEKDRIYHHLYKAYKK